MNEGLSGLDFSLSLLLLFENRSSNFCVLKNHMKRKKKKKKTLQHQTIFLFLKHFVSVLFSVFVPCVCVCAVSSRVRAVSVAPTRKKIFFFLRRRIQSLWFFFQSSRSSCAEEFLFFFKKKRRTATKEEIKSNKKKKSFWKINEFKARTNGVYVRSVCDFPRRHFGAASRRIRNPTTSNGTSDMKTRENKILT